MQGGLRRLNQGGVKLMKFKLLLVPLTYRKRQFVLIIGSELLSSSQCRYKSFARSIFSHLRRRF